jgi:Flp pilus assembly protein TadD
MFGTRLGPLAVIAVITSTGFQNVWARDLSITLPKRSELTPVQRLNREGVEAIQKHQYDKAEAIFYKAYLYDPADPFTLNNLGYTSELQGQLDRAQTFYKLASEQGSAALIDRSNAKQLIGKPVSYAFNNLKDAPMRVNRMNVQAIELLSQGQNFEADSLLRQTLALDPHNPFTLNNLGVAEEATGDYESALKYYDSAADSQSSEPIVVTLNGRSRGKPVSKVAAESARQLKERMQNVNTAEERAAMLTLRGVSEANQNDWRAAKQDFLHAYSLDPDSAFSLNNLGYVAERDGDLETAEFYYAKARKAGDANARVGLATQRSAEGTRLSTVAADSNQKVDGELEKYSQARHQQTGPIELTPRDNTLPGNSGASPEKQSPDKPSPSDIPSPVSPSSAPQSPN